MSFNVAAGTPDGVGDTFNPPKYLNDGDIVEITISQIGTLKNFISRPNGTEAYKKATTAVTGVTGLSEDLGQYIA